MKSLSSSARNPHPGISISVSARQSKVRIVVNKLENAILDRQYLQGTLMPSQNELCRLYGVSARTMREAFKILEAKGLVTVSRVEDHM